MPDVEWLLSPEGAAEEFRDVMAYGGDPISNYVAAMRDSFQHLTGGKAVFGQPGVGCRGPYKINRFELVTVER